MIYNDDINLVKTMFDSLIDITENEWYIMKKHLHRVEYRKNEIILDTGNKEDYVYFLAKGIIRYFFYSNKNQDYTLGFRTAPSGFSAYSSFVKRCKSNVGSQAMSPVVAYKISYDEMESLYIEVNKMERLSRMFLQLAYVEKEQKEFNLLSRSATDFYHYLCVNYPDIIETVPQKYIASYMGVAPESLSRIKKDILINKKQG